MDSKRPDFHFTPPKNWMNDPNGLIYHQGVYHLYYQHNPVSPYFGNISWGHATSIDLKDWKHQPLALTASSKTMIYSGCVIYDKDNLLNQEKASLVAIYTEHIGDETNYHEQICLAISKDDGQTFDQANRQIILKENSPDFRDPKVFYHDSSGKWIMVVALPKSYTICIYTSENLIDWNHQSDFSSTAPHAQFWECPDLFPLMDEKGDKYWILSLSGENYQGSHQGWGMFYFVGQFDGEVFTTMTNHQWLDFGRDFYAGITFSQNDDQKIMMAWCNNWLTANQTHSRDWSGILSSPRKLKLKNKQVIHELITNIQAIVPNPNSMTDLWLPLNRCQISIIDDTIQINKNGHLIDRRSFPYRLQNLRVFEDHGIVEILINEGLSATWLV